MPKKNKNKTEIIESALKGGLVGAALGALLTGKKEDSITAAIVGAAIGASVKALEEARENKLPVMFEEDGVLYELHPNGRRTTVNNSVEKGKTRVHIPRNFKLD